MSNYLISKKAIDNFMNLNFVAQKAEISDTNSSRKLSVKIDSLHYFTVLNDNYDFQLPIINFHGDIKDLRKVLIDSNIAIKKQNEQSIKLINEFIDKINNIFINEKFPKFNGDTYKKTVISGHFIFVIKIIIVPFFDENMIVSERINFRFQVENISYNNKYKESLKFMIHDEDFQFAKNKRHINDVDINFFIKRLKKMFINYNKSIIEQYDIDISNKMLFDKDSEDYFEMVRDTIRMINI